MTVRCIIEEVGATGGVHDPISDVVKVLDGYSRGDQLHSAVGCDIFEAGQASDAGEKSGDCPLALVARGGDGFVFSLFLASELSSRTQTNKLCAED